MSDSDQTNRPGHGRLGVLDGWRGISILLVLWGHWFPAGPRDSGMNLAVALSGMALFFTLSGFLITTFLHERPRVLEFLIRRLMRIVPLAWLYMTVVLLVVGADPARWPPHLLFYGNLPPFPLLPSTAHLWSLCVELHFYLGAALLVALAGRNALFVLPLVGLAVTCLRVAYGQHESIVTWFRIDEILAGATLALIRLRWGPRLAWAGTGSVPMAGMLVLSLLLLSSGNPLSGGLNYARPYLAALLVGLTLFARGGALVRWLENRVLAYVAKVSYALYVFHGGLNATWLGSGEGWAKYVKRPLLLAATFALAHLSTMHFESRAIDLGRRWSLRLRSATA